MSQKQIPGSNKDSYPYLVLPTKHKQFFCRPDSKCRPRTRTVPELRYRDILSSSSLCGNYWHLIHDYSSNAIDLLLWNQTSGDTITLPPLQEDYTDFDSSILWLAKGLVLLFHITDQYLIFCKFDTNNNDACDRSWTVMHYGETMRRLFGDDHPPDFVKLLHNPFFYNDELYAVNDYSDDVVIIKVDVPGELSFERNDFTMPPLDAIGCLVRTYVLESLGDLITIYITMGGVRENEIIDVGIYKLDFESKDWNMASLKDRVIFLGSSHSFSHLTKEMGGRVFFTRYGDRSLYSFNIEDESLTITLPIPNLPNSLASPYWLPSDQAHNYIDEETHNDIGEDEEDDEEEEDQKDEDEDEDEEKDYDYHDDELYKDEDDSVSISMCKATEYPIIVVEEEKGEKINLITKLGPDIVGEIVRKFAFIDFLNFRAVNNSCRLAAPLTNLPKPQTQPSLPPWSILSSGRTIYVLVDPTSNGKYCMRIPEHLINTKIRYSHDGWMLMSNISSSHMFFYNPFTKDTIRLPDLPRGYIDFPTFGFSSSSSSSSTLLDWVCVTLKSIPDRRSNRITYIKSGEEEWHHVAIRTSLKFEPNHNTPVVLFDKEGHGCFYFLGRHGNLGVLRLDENRRSGVKWEVLENPKTPCHWKSYESNFLIECGGELVSVFVGVIGTWVRVFKLNHIQMVWERVTNLGDYMLFISRYSCLSQLATIPTMANRIYFPKFSQDDRVVYYSLHTKKFHYSESGIGMASQGDAAAATATAPFFDSFYSESIKGPLQSGWLTPRFS